MMEIVAASGNRGKVAEFAAALEPLGVRLLSLKDFDGIVEPLEDGATFVENAMIKAEYYARATGKPCLADDSGLEVDALGGAPGVYSARYAGPEATDDDNNRKLLAALTGVPEVERTGRFRCVLAFADPSGGRLTAEGSCEGLILEARRGTGGFGYDPLFFVPGLGKTLAEVDLAEKNAISHRGQALRSMAEKLAVFLNENRCDQ